MKIRKEITLHQYYKMRNEEFKKRIKNGILSDEIKLSKYDDKFIQFDKEYFIESFGSTGGYKAKFI